MENVSWSSNAFKRPFASILAFVWSRLASRYHHKVAHPSLWHSQGKRYASNDPAKDFPACAKGEITFRRISLSVSRRIHHTNHKSSSGPPSGAIGDRSFSICTSRSRDKLTANYWSLWPFCTLELEIRHHIFMLKWKFMWYYAIFAL